MADNLFNKLTGASSNINFICDLPSGKLIYTDSYTRTLLRIESEDVLSGAVLKYLSSQERAHFESHISAIIAGTFKGAAEFCLEIGEETKWVRVTPFLLNWEERSVIAGNIIDITDEVNNVNILKKYANKKNSILNLLSHDLRGPLGIANTITDVLSKEVSDPHLVNFVKTIAKILNQSINLITDLTNREFLETVEVELVKKRIDIVKTLSDVMDEYRRSEWSAERVFLFSSSSDSIFINLDESKFIQVVNNLMTNALKFTRNKGTISLTVTERESSVLFIFSDNGIGIPGQFHSSLFEKFTDARRKGLRGEPTVGLGLSIVKTIIDWHKGEIWFESKENEGTSFYIEIPKVQ